MSEGHEALSTFDIAWRLGLTVFFVALNGFFVAAEFALVKVRGARVDALVAEGRRGATTVQHVHRNLDRYLSACQLGITLASLILGALGEPAVSVLLIAGFAAVGIGVASASWLPIVSIGLAFAVITTLHMTIGEQAPKMWAIRRAEGMALATAPTLRAFAFVFTPFIAAINSISNWMLRLIGLPSDGGHHEATHDVEEIRSILSLSAGAGQISEREYEMAENIFRMTQLEVRHILVPRADIELLSLAGSADDSLGRIRETAHSRLPLCEVGLDTIIGFIHTKDLVGRSLDDPALDLRELAREAHFVPDTMALPTFLSELQQHQAQCAAVVDERGTVIGFAFREDALEEVVGPLGDEFDDPEREYREVREGVYEFPGNAPLPEVLDRLGMALDDEEREEEDTLGGHVTARLGRLARAGDMVQMGPFRVEVVEAGPRRIERLRVQRHRGDDAPANAADASAG